jgi:hypothetical protein
MYRLDGLHEAKELQRQKLEVDQTSSLQRLRLIGAFPASKARAQTPKIVIKELSEPRLSPQWMSMSSFAIPEKHADKAVPIQDLKTAKSTTTQ